MSVRVAGSWLFLSLVIASCDSSSNGPIGPTGPEPAVFVSLPFGDPPVEGELVLSPSPETTGWRYAVDLDGTGGPDRSGVLVSETRIPYRFDEPGIHTILVELEGPEGRSSRHIPVAVNDPESAFDILGVTQLPAGLLYEGIAIDHEGERLYVGAFGDNKIFSVRASDLGDLRGPLELEGSGVEGLAVAPGDSLLYAIHKGRPFSVIAIPSLEVRRVHESLGGYFVRALGERHALTSGLFTLDVVNTLTGEVTASGVDQAHHFAISPDGSLVAVLEDHDPQIDLLELPSLVPRLVIDLPTLLDADAIAFHPESDRLYVIGKDAEFDVRFLVLDVATGSSISDVSLGPGGCRGFCVANPVATTASGRWVGFEQGSSLLIVDTETDAPRLRFGAEQPEFAATGASVAADPHEDVFYVLSGSGLLQKVAIRE